MLFLDDFRIPENCISYMHLRIGSKNPLYLQEWVIAKNGKEFKDIIEKNGMPEIISFDHDLAEEHYINGDLDLIDRMESSEMTGYDCAKWLIEYLMENDVALPEIFVHSMNPAGTDNIIKFFDSYRKHCKK